MSAVYAFETGRAGNATVATAVAYITKWQAKKTTNYSDSTSSASYADGELWTTQEPGTSSVEGTVEGWFDFGTGASSAPVLAAVGAGPVALVLMFDEDNTYCSGNFNFTDFDTGVEVKEGSPTIGFTASIKSYGPVTMLPSGS